MTLNFKIKSKGLDKNTDMLDNTIRGMDIRNINVLEETANKIIFGARDTLQNRQNVDSGRLLAATKIIEMKDNFIRLGNELGYAGIIEFGRGPITAKPGKVLHFRSKTTGEDVFVKFVGPVEPMPFLGPMVAKFTALFPDLYVKNEKESMRSSL